MDPLTAPLSDPIIMPPVPPVHHSHLKLEIIAGIILVIIVAIAVAFSFGNSWLKTSQRVSLVGTATTTVYTLSGSTLTFVSAAPTESQLGKNLGTGHALGALPNGALLALTPLGLSMVKEDGTAFQIVNAGGTGSTTPLGAATSDLSTIAIENQTMHAVYVYHFNPVSMKATYLMSTDSSAPALTASTTPKGYTRMHLKSGEFVFVKDSALPKLEKTTTSATTTPSAPLAVKAAPSIVAIGMTKDAVIVEDSLGMITSYPFVGASRDGATKLSLIKAK